MHKSRKSIPKNKKQLRLLWIAITALHLPKHYTFGWNKKGDTPLLNASSASATAYKNELISYLYNAIMSHRDSIKKKPINKKQRQHKCRAAEATATVPLHPQTTAMKLKRKQEKQHHHHQQQKRKSSENSVYQTVHLLREWVCCIQCI